MTAIEEFLHDLEPSVRTSDGVRRNAGTLYGIVRSETHLSCFLSGFFIDILMFDQ